MNDLCQNYNNGILSPHLFALFVDKVLSKLELSGLGCYSLHKCYNSFMYMYANDLINISSTVTDLQLLFTLCSEILTTLDLPININKCFCLRIGPRCNVECRSLKIQGIDVKWVKCFRYIGVTICRAQSRFNVIAMRLKDNSIAVQIWFFNKG